MVVDHDRRVTKGIWDAPLVHCDAIARMVKISTRDSGWRPADRAPAVGRKPVRDDEAFDSKVPLIQCPHCPDLRRCNPFDLRTILLTCANAQGWGVIPKRGKPSRRGGGEKQVCVPNNSNETTRKGP